MNALGGFTFALLTAAFISPGVARAAEPSSEGTVLLAAAIASFNAKAQESPIGLEQPALSEEEVVAAIRWWEFHRGDAPVSDEEFRAFQHIAATHRLPAGAEFEVLTGFEPSDQITFEAWSVRIRMPRPGGGAYAFLIRERMIRSRLIGVEERKVIQKWRQAPMGSFQRVEYRKAREAAAALDRAKHE